MSQSASTKNAEECGKSDRRAAAGAAVGDGIASVHPELAEVVERWPELPEAIRAGILAMVRAQ